MLVSEITTSEIVRRAAQTVERMNMIRCPVPSDRTQTFEAIEDILLDNYMAPLPANIATVEIMDWLELLLNFPEGGVTIGYEQEPLLDGNTERVTGSGSTRVRQAAQIVERMNVVRCPVPSDRTQTFEAIVDILMDNNWSDTEARFVARQVMDWLELLLDFPEGGVTINYR